MPVKEKQLIYYNVIFKHDILHHTARNTAPTVVYKKGEALLRKISKRDLQAFIDLEVIEEPKVGGKLLLRPLDDFIFIEVSKVTSTTTTEKTINPENL